jgi:pyruvate formate lyase activating enzyme
MLYDRLGENRVRCKLCAHRCLIRPDKVGVCGVRENAGGTLYTMVYGKTISTNVDPIEKKPLFHFHPGSPILSIATVGCNFRCLHCQNHDISQMPGDKGSIAGRDVPPQQVVAMAEKEGCRSIAYTYTEPTIFFEYAYDTARLAHGKGMKNVFVTNGYMTEEALETIRPYLHAANVDLKGFSEKFYKTVCGGRLEPVLDSLKRMVAMGVWVEVTTLVIPYYNDSTQELSSIAEFIRHELGAEVPWHISRFHPTYKLTDRVVTPVSTLHRAREIGLDAGLKYVYTGNVPGDQGESTLCPGCGQVIIGRMGYHIREINIEDSRCNKCGTAIAGEFEGL